MGSITTTGSGPRGRGRATATVVSREGDAVCGGGACTGAGTGARTIGGRRPRACTRNGCTGTAYMRDSSLSRDGPDGHRRWKLKLVESPGRISLIIKEVIPCLPTINVEGRHDVRESVVHKCSGQEKKNGCDSERPGQSLLKSRIRLTHVLGRKVFPHELDQSVSCDRAHFRDGCSEPEISTPDRRSATGDSK